MGGEFEKYLISQTPLGRFGQPGDIAPIAVFLSSEASFWIHRRDRVIGGRFRVTDQPEVGKAGQYKAVSRYLPAYRIEGQKEHENGAASPFLLLKSVSDDVDWPHNDNRVHGKRYSRMNGRH